MDTNQPTKQHSRTGRSVQFFIIPAAAFAFGIAGTVFIATARHDPLRGVYRQEVVPIVADTSGAIVSIDSPHGKEVRPGDALLTLTNGEAAAKLKTATASAARLRRELDDAKAKASVELALRLDGLNKERLEMRLRYADLLRERLDVQLRRKALENGERVGEPIAGSAVHLTLTSVEAPGRMRQLELADTANHEEVLNTQVALCEDRLAELDKLSNELPASLDRVCRIDAIEAELAAVTSECEQLEETEATRAVTSTTFGRVGVYRRQPGDFVSAGETIVEIYDSERPYVLVTISIADMVRFTPGRHVRVEFEGTPTRKPLEGVIAEVVSEAERDADAAAAPGAATAIARITPVGRLWPTPPAGATAIVHLLP